MTVLEEQPPKLMVIKQGGNYPMERLFEFSFFDFSLFMLQLLHVCGLSICNRGEKSNSFSIIM